MALIGRKAVLKKVIIPLNTDFLLGVNPELKMWRMYGNITYNFLSILRCSLYSCSLSFKGKCDLCKEKERARVTSKLSCRPVLSLVVLLMALSISPSQANETSPSVTLEDSYENYSISMFCATKLGHFS